MPLVAFALKPEKLDHGYTEFDVADRLRQAGWVLPVRGVAGDGMPARSCKGYCSARCCLWGIPCCAAWGGS